MIIKEIKCKSCMTKSKLTDYVINPYVGCQHGCKYCYADFIRRFQNIPERWGSFVYARMNSPELLVKELERNPKGHIWLASVCDCYMPAEINFKLTRKILETIAGSPFKKKFTIEILTKSVLVERDFGLLKDLDVELGCSINTLDEKYSKYIEPLASLPKERIEVLKKAKKNGIKVYAFISPVMPGITNLDALFKELNFCDYVWVEILNIRKPVLNRLLPIIKENFPELMGAFEEMIQNYDQYCDVVEKEAWSLSKKYKLKIKEVVRHDRR